MSTGAPREKSTAARPPIGSAAPKERNSSRAEQERREKEKTLRPASSCEARSPLSNLPAGEENRLRTAWRIPRRPGGDGGKGGWRIPKRPAGGAENGNWRHQRRREEYPDRRRDRRDREKKPRKPKSAAERRILHIEQTAKKAREALTTLNNKDVAALLGLSVDVRTEAERRRQERRYQRREERRRREAVPPPQEEEEEEEDIASSSLSSSSEEE